MPSGPSKTSAAAGDGDRRPGHASALPLVGRVALGQGRLSPRADGFAPPSSPAAPLCVVGRTDFATGIGAVAYAAAELFSRTMPTCFHALGPKQPPRVVLPNGRVVPHGRWGEIPGRKILVYTDVLWNGALDNRHELVPAANDVLKIAYMAWDSDELPPEWVRILNAKFDAVLFTSQHLEQVAAQSGVTIPIGTLPLALDIEGLLVRPFRQPSPGGRIRFGSTASFHQRKGALALIEAFADEFGDVDDVELLIHSNLAIDCTYAAAEALVKERGLRNVRLSHEPLNDAAHADLLDSIDVYCSCSAGEGYSIGPRQALALGKPVVLTAIGAHRELLTPPGSFAIPATGDVPACYPEIDGRIFGRQNRFSPGDIRAALRAAWRFVRSGAAHDTVAQRKQLAAGYSFAALQGPYAAVVLGRRDASPAIVRAAGGSAQIPDGLVRRAEQILGRFRAGLGHRCKRVVPCRDAGFFSVFNTFFSHLVWDSHDPRCLGTFPDWRVAPLLERLKGRPPKSFCYGREDDGNLWLSFFEPLFGATRDEMNDPGFLEANMLVPADDCNADREPLLTYVDAAKLYRAPWFAAFRREYHRHFRQHVRLLPHLQAEIDQFCAPFAGRLMIAAHVKHPSHVIEQASGTIAGVPEYLARISAVLRQAGVSMDDPGWGIFLATDREVVVDEFLDHFGDRVRVFRDVRRTTRRDDEAFARLPARRQRAEGHMIQHLVAADAAAWTTRMGWEVIRDAYVMARCDVLLHVVSNISTAVSYINPDVTLVHLDGEGR